jgi:hypothetical protein
VSKDRTGIFSGDPKPITVETGKRLAEWLAGAEPAPAPKPEPAPAPGRADVEQIRGYIRAATTVRTLGKIVDRLDQLVSEDQITGNEWSELTDLVAARHDQIQPQTEAAT